MKLSTHEDYALCTPEQIAADIAQAYRDAGLDPAEAPTAEDVRIERANAGLRKLAKPLGPADLYARSNHPCIVCGKGVKETGPIWFVHVIDGGSRVLHPDDEAAYQPDGGDCGCHPVGPECRKLFGAFAFKADMPR